MFPKELVSRLSDAGVVAGFSITDPRKAVPIAEALLSGGVQAIELTLRTSHGIEAVRAISQGVPEILLGVGTILTPEQAAQVADAGAHFGVAPGFNPRVVKAAAQAGIPFAPGVATPSDIEAALELNCRFLKLFPAEHLGGLRYLQAIATPYKHLGVRFFPLGGLNAQNMSEYLADPLVAAIGGSWIVQQDLVDNQDWSGIAARAAEARRVMKQSRRSPERSLIPPQKTTSSVALAGEA